MAHRTRHLCRVSEMPHPVSDRLQPYGNSSYLVPSVVGSLDRYTLYRSCRSPCAVSRWNQVRACQVSNAAYTRGYGTPEEAALVTTQTWNSWSFDISRYLNLSPFQKNRNS